MSESAEFKSTDFTEEMQDDAATQASVAVEQFDQENDVSRHIKRFFDAKYYPTWHCVTGSDFASTVSGDVKAFAYFKVGTLSILLWKCG